MTWIALSLGDTAAQREPPERELSNAIERYQSREMSFWLPQAEGTLAQVEGR
jgi:hypothetical protein